MAHRNFFLITAVLVLLTTSVFGQQIRPLAANDVEYLLQGSVTVKRLTEIVNESGVKFQLSNFLKERFRKAGADASLLEAIERAGSKRKNTSKREIIELAKKEAMVVWYSSIQSPLSEELCNRFNSKNFGITCVVHRSGSGNLYRQLVAESTSAVNKADVIHASNLDDFVR